jgi:hypothetical protein
MKLTISGGQYVISLALSLCGMGLLLSPSPAAAQPEPKFVIKPVAEKKLAQLPAGPLYWHVEYFPTLAQAQAASRQTSLAVEEAGKVWLFTLGPKGSP